MLTKRRWPALLALSLLLPSFLWSTSQAAPAVPNAPTVDNTSKAFTWNEGTHFSVVEYWNAPSRAGCDYASHPWPQAELAAQRAYVLGARQVLRDEWNINAWITANRAATSEVHIHGAETNCPIENGTPHLDYPPHVHVFYLARASNGAWQQINSHHYPDAQGKIYDNFIIPSLCSQGASYHPAAGAWVAILDETCAAAWQQRYTPAGDLELRRNSSAAGYALHLRALNGDLSSLDVLSAGNVIYNIDIVRYDPIGEIMVARITDHRKNLVTTETWQGDPARNINLTGHSIQTAPFVPVPTRARLFLPLIRRP